MNEFRVFLTCLVFLVSSYLVVDVVFFQFDWTLLGIAVIGYFASHYIWPKHCKQKSAWYDALEFIIDLPFRLVVETFKGIVRFIREIFTGLDL